MQVGYAEIAILSPSRFIACCQRWDRLGIINTAMPDRGKLWHLLLVVSGRVCWWRETTTKCLWQKKYQRYTKTTTEQNLIVRIDKSEAEVTNDKRLCPSLCTIEANCMYTVSQKLRQQCMSKLLLIVVGACLSRNNKNSAIANRSRVSCAQNTSRASPWPFNLG